MNGSCCGPSRHGAPVLVEWENRPGAGAPADVVRVAGGRTIVGTNGPEIPHDGEGPERAVTVSDFGLEATTVTNERFARFVEATGYVCEAERFGWSAVFRGDREDVEAARRAGSALPWWHRVEGANWRQPEGPGSAITNRMDHPVVQISWADANAFAAWVGGRLPSEAEWEHAARGGPGRKRFPWGDDEPNDTETYCNIWQGSFPTLNTKADGYGGTAPARSFQASALGFYNMSGNVWEWTHDAFRVRSMSRTARQRNADALAHSEKVLKGGSFLCHISYCYRYRIAARMAMTPDSAGSNVGFRVAYDLPGKG